MDVKFSFAIGNPPYQEETVGDQKTFAPPVYHKFLESAYGIAHGVEMIHPARFLFRAGATPKTWNDQMLEDNHLKVKLYEGKSSQVFLNTDIKGGLAVTYHDDLKTYDPVGVFTSFPELNSVYRKVWKNGTESLSSIVSNRGQYRFSELAYKEQPEELKKVTDARISSPAFERMPALFTEEKPDDGYEYIQIYGVMDKQRVYRWFRKEYLAPIDALYKYKVMVPKANGSGALGEIVTTPVIGTPVIGHTETFISIGCVDTMEEAEAILKYVKSKFARVMLGILKTTQDNSKNVWKYVPLQDFTDWSDIDWSQPVSAIDRQLYRKYGLDDTEVKFIESHVKEMK